jgi:hypothetical protein
MIGFSLNPPMADLNLAGNFGGLLQVDADDARLMTSQVSLPGLFPPQMSSLEKPLNKIKIFESRLHKVRLGQFKLGYVRLG